MRDCVKCGFVSDFKTKNILTSLTGQEYNCRAKKTQALHKFTFFLWGENVGKSVRGW